LLQNALPHLAPGGRLVYSTCSLEPEENEDVVNEVLRNFKNSFCIVNAKSAIEKFLQKTTPVERVVSTDGFFYTFPGEHEVDGFFGAIIMRSEEKI
jgi:16S rRNA (cytosine967-C5)-methyltransferase